MKKSLLFMDHHTQQFQDFSVLLDDAITHIFDWLGSIFQANLVRAEFLVPTSSTYLLPTPKALGRRTWKNIGHTFCQEV